MIDGWDNSDEKQQLSQAMAEAREKPPAKTLLDKKWKPPGWWVQVWVLTVRRLNTIINNKQETLTPAVIFLVLGFILSTYVVRTRGIDSPVLMLTRVYLLL
jgi:hypothetical protein